MPLTQPPPGRFRLPRRMFMRRYTGCQDGPRSAQVASGKTCPPGISRPRFLIRDVQREIQLRQPRAETCFCSTTAGRGVFGYDAARGLQGAAAAVVVVVFQVAPEGEVFVAEDAAEEAGHCYKSHSQIV